LGVRRTRQPRRDDAEVRAMTVKPGQKGTAGVEEVPDSRTEEGTLLVRGRAVGVCGTDREIAEGGYGTPPFGAERLIIGHESLGKVLVTPAGSGFSPGDLVVGIVRRPDPAPCPACAAGEWDMCRTDNFGERGIVRLHGYGSERWRVEPDFAVPISSRLGHLGVLAPCGQGVRDRRARHPRPPLYAIPRPDTTFLRSLASKGGERIAAAVSTAGW
jgi:threonine dehydrogenase-like Zn-dependent dehydrogenase